MKFILHIGVWKTGSSAIQSFLSLNRKELKRRGIVWPTAFTKHDGHNAIVHALRDDDDAKLDALIDGAVRDARDVADPTIILSSEHFWPVERKRLVRLHERLSAHGPTKVVAYIRPQEEMWASLYAQQAKAFRITADTPLWGDASYLSSRIVDHGLYFGKCLTLFKRNFDEIDVRRYDRSRFLRNDAVADFLSATGLLDHDGLDFSKSEANPSFGWKGAGFAMWCAEEVTRRGMTRSAQQKIKQHLAITVRDMAEITGDHHWMGRAPAFLNASIKSDIRRHYAEDDMILSKRFFGGAPAWGPPIMAETDPFGPDKIPQAEFEAAQQRFLRRLARKSLKTLIPGRFLGLA